MVAILCCAACLHAIVAPASPVLVEGRYFHLDHLPAESGLLLARPTAMAA